MRTLVTGGTGFIGAHLVDELLRCGHEVRCLVRSRSARAELLQKKGAELHFGDLSKSSTLKGVARDVDLVYHLAALLGDATREPVMLRVNVEGTRALLMACRKAAPRFLFASSAAVHGAGRHLSERSSLRPEGAYGTSKAAAESLVGDSGLEVLILRPGFVFGPGDYRMARFLRLAARRVVPLPDGGADLLQPLFVDDLVGMLMALGQNGRGSEILIAAGETVLSWAELLQRTASPKKPLIVSVPMPLCRAAGVMGDALGRFLGSETALSSRRLALLAGSRTYDTSALKGALHPTFTPLDTALGLTRAWMRGEGLWP